MSGKEQKQVERCGGSPGNPGQVLVREIPVPGYYLPEKEWATCPGCPDCSPPEPEPVVRGQLLGGTSAVGLPPDPVEGERPSRIEQAQALTDEQWRQALLRRAQDAEAEVERLRSEVRQADLARDEMERYYTATREQLEQERLKLKGSRGATLIFQRDAHRYEEALERIADVTGTSTEAHHIARAALDNEKT